MAYADPTKARAAKRRYLERKKVEKYGPASAGKDMRGRHGKHARGARSPRWKADGRRVTSHGYIAVRVAPDHPHGWGPPHLRGFRYAYEHILIAMERLGRPLTAAEAVHHKNGIRTDNRPENLEVLSRASHALEHATAAQRDKLGRFIGGRPRVREFPEGLR